MKTTVRIYALCENTIYFKTNDLTDIQQQKVKQAVLRKIEKMLHPSFWSWSDKINRNDLVGMYLDVNI